MADSPADEERKADATGSRFCSAIWWLVYLAAWGVTIGLAAVAALRVFYHDGEFVLIWANSFTRYVYLPVYLCVAWAFWQRRWGLLATGLAVVVCHWMWLAPNFLRDRRFDSPGGPSSVAASTSPTLRIFFANVAASNTEHQALLDEIAAADPDVILLAEFGPQWIGTFLKSPQMAAYQREGVANGANFALLNVFTKQSPRSEKENWVNGRGVQTLEVELGNDVLRIIGLHAPRPIAGPRYEYRSYWSQMISFLISQPGPVVIVGDFNATEHSQVYKELTADRLRSAHDDRGRGYATTWPNGKNWLPPVRIDQVLLSPDVECVRIVEGVGRGSDHKPLIVDIRIRDTPGQSQPALAN